MRKILNKYSCVFFFFVGSFVMLVSAQPPPDDDCCRDLELDNSPEGTAEYNKCRAMEDANAGSYCKPVLPIDNSFYILIGAAAAFSLASVVILKKIKHKKTPM